MKFLWRIIQKNAIHTGYVISPYDGEKHYIGYV